MANISGELKQHHIITLEFDGPASDVQANPNPFTDYRLDVIFNKSLSGSGNVLYIYGDVDEDGYLAGDPMYNGTPYHQMRLNDSGSLGMSQFKTEIESQGFTITEAYDQSITLDAAFLAGYDILIFGSNQKTWSAAEAAALDVWVRAGGAVWGYSDSAFGGAFNNPAPAGINNEQGRDSMNILFAQFGMQFYTDQGGPGIDVVNDYELAHPINNNELNSSAPDFIEFEGEGCSPVRIDPNWPQKQTGDAVFQLARWQDNGVDKNVTDVDLPNGINAQLNCALAVSQVGLGRVVGYFDRNTFWNNGPGTHINNKDHKALVRGIINWLGSTNSIVVPGYYAADGNAANTLSNVGNKWKCHFNPPEAGTYIYTAQFTEGSNVNQNGGGTSAGFLDGDSGTFVVAATDKVFPDMRAKGKLEYVGEHYLQHKNGDYFLKAGPDSPENFLAYDDFADTPNNMPNPGAGSKSYSPHSGDWVGGDPEWNGGQGRNIIGAVNYLASKGLNTISFLTMNINGDDRNCFMYPGSNDRLRISVRKCDQWFLVLQHLDSKGFNLSFKTQERENDGLLDGGNLGNERKLYYRELIARFGVFNGITWNMGEETTRTSAQLIDYAQYFADNDPYKSNIVVHNFPNQENNVFPPLYNTAFTGVSIQCNGNIVHQRTKTWVDNSANSGKKWIVANDEQGPFNAGVLADANYSGNQGLFPNQDNHDDITHQVLWGNILAGGPGIEIYYGYQTGETDLSLQDHRSRSNMYDYMDIALTFFRTNIGNDIINWTNRDDLIGNPSHNGQGNFCFAKPGTSYIVFADSGSTVTLDLEAYTDVFDVQWFDPYTGSTTPGNTLNQSGAGGQQSIGTPPSNNHWVAYITIGTPAGGPPGCTSMSSPTNGAVNVDKNTTVTWQGASGQPTGYKIRMGTTPGGSDIANNVDLGNVNTYTPPSALTPGQIYYVLITPYNSFGDAAGCVEESFTVDAFVVTGCPYVEANNLVTIDMDSVPRPGLWELLTAVPGYTGSGYLMYEPANTSAGIIQAANITDEIEILIKINNPGTYRVQGRSFNSDTVSNTEYNDIWLQSPDADMLKDKNGTISLVGRGWTKYYQNNQEFTWTWNTFHVDNDPHNLRINFPNAGLYRLRIAARSYQFGLDRLVLYNEDLIGTGAATNTGNTADLPEKPVLTLTGSSTMNIPVNSVFVDPGASALDPNYGDISGSITISGTVNTAVPGTYVRTYNVTNVDSCAADPIYRTVVVETGNVGGLTINYTNYLDVLKKSRQRRSGE